MCVERDRKENKDRLYKQAEKLKRMGKGRNT